ncbi:hypothetical protein [Streptomyces sp. NPDC050264]|uniref:hypothetical protein n=1 Tax=Streptomyces sp. NPDC050264 TaxID=3155038 RepID=UPI003412FCAF
MTRSGVAEQTGFLTPDPRFPFPHSETPTSYATDPGLFDLDYDERGRERADID